MRMLYPAGTAMPATKGTVVIATLEGDVHDLGKNILKMVLIANGYRVVDCGKDCPLERFLHDVEEERPFAVGISGLITTVIPLVRQVKGLLRRHQLELVKVMAGGAALKQSTPDRLQVDYVAESAFDALHYLDELMGGGA
jgi:methanogenic corrinoid protein MtbC1